MALTGHVSDAVIRRLPSYYRHMLELERAGVEVISSQELGERMKQTPSQIRQDINCFGGFGRQGYGYRVRELRERLGQILGLDRRHRMIILGAGSIGTAVARYPGFRADGFETAALFDMDPARQGTRCGDAPVYPMERLEGFLREQPADIAVIALPAEAAQAALERLTACGVRAIWNFAPTDLVHDADTRVVNVHLSDSLHVLSYLMTQAALTAQPENKTT